MAMEGTEARTQGELELLKFWLKRYMASEAYCRKFFDLGKENYALYKSYQKRSEKIYSHSIFVPYSFAYLEDQTAYFMLSILSSPITFSLFPRFQAISIDLCKELEQVVHWVLTDENAEFVLEVEELIKNVGIYNAASLINYALMRQKEFASVLEPGKKYTKTVFDRLHLDTPSTLDVFPEPRVKRLSRMEWVIKKSRESYSILKSLENEPGGYENVDAARGGFKDEDPAIVQVLKEVGIDTSEQLYDPREDSIELLDCLFDGHVITIGGRKAIIRDTTKDSIRPFSFKLPLLDCRMTGAPGEYFGTALLESIKPTQRELNLLRSQRRDNVSLLLNKLFIWDYMAGEVDINTFFSAPGNVIMTTNRDAIDEFPISDVTASSYKEEAALIYDLQNISALWDYARGGTPRRKETATGIIRLQQAAQARNEWNLRKLDQYILMPLCRRILVCIKENMSREQYTDIVGRENHGPEFFDLDTDDVKRMFQIMPMTESIVSIKEVDTAMFIQAFDRLVQMPEVNRPELIKQLLQKIGQRDIKSIVPMLSEAGQAYFLEGIREGAQMPPALPGMAQPNFAGMEAAL